jgi:hypothetical protein
MIVITSSHFNRQDYERLDDKLTGLMVDWLKWDSWVEEQHDRLLKVWAEADRPYSHENGVSPKLSIANGKVIPEGVQKEHQRQKDLGWDVHGNIE